jgi:transcriptional regulator with XRE-family HTH domain
MSVISEKIRILRKNREWTQAQLADALSISESTVQKWEVDKNAPPVSEIKRLAEVFYLPVISLVDDAVNIPEFYFLETIPAEDFYPRPAATDSTPHKVYDAGLIKNANLHRFLNKAGEPYSAIYVGRDERLSCERGHEQGMIDYWNQG